MRSTLFHCIFVCILFYLWNPVYGQETDVQVHFRVKWDGKVIPGITQVSGLRRVTEAIEHRSGGDPSVIRYSPGLSKYVPIVLKRPRTHDKEFEQWANKVWNLDSGLGTEVSLRDFRKDIIIEIYEDMGRVLMSFKVYRSWPSDYIALTDLDVDKETLAMEVLTLHHEGWERDYSVE